MYPIVLLIFPKFVTKKLLLEKAKVHMKTIIKC